MQRKIKKWVRAKWKNKAPINRGLRRLFLLCDTAEFGIDPIPNKYRVSIADTDTHTDTFNL